ncbi:MAG: DUF4301 family protein [Bacteroidota bacterium]
MFSDKDIKQLESKGIGVGDIENQLSIFRKGIPFLKVEAPATPERGIVQLSENDIKMLNKAYDQASEALDILKFVPASGAASRMFKKLFEYAGSKNDHPDSDIQRFIHDLPQFAFFDALKKSLADAGYDYQALLNKKDYKTIINQVLLPEGLDYGSLPKALLLFHKYPDGPRTSLEEHLAEGAMYAKSKSNVVNIHLTVSPEHEEGFESKIANTKTNFEKKYDVTYNITFSQQKPSTDTIAVDMDNQPFRLDDGTLLFRPGGHGALLENLKEIDADIIFIKNIDNVVPDNIKGPTVTFKKALAGKLLELQSKIFSFIQTIDAGTSHIGDMEAFFQSELFFTFPDDYASFSNEDKIKYLKEKLNRPIRVCGMVKNEGEPGGGPFLARNPDGSVSLQVVESSQIDLDNPQQKKLFDGATHFNPVDLVVATKNYKGETFDLTKFRDPQTAFISKKSKEGSDLKALELPGLWNGAMSDWNTLFVEVPIITFNPVKTVFDLLREQHQNT